MLCFLFCLGDDYTLNWHLFNLSHWLRQPGKKNTAKYFRFSVSRQIINNVHLLSDNVSNQTLAGFLVDRSLNKSNARLYHNNLETYVTLKPIVNASILTI